MFLAMITQRPSELSDTCVSQCANFVILRTMHPVDLKYIKEMVPNISQEIVLQLKNLKPGNCIAFGSAFKVPTSMYIDLPNPRPLSNNVDLEKVWYQSPSAAPTPTNVAAPQMQAPPPMQIAPGGVRVAQAVQQPAAIPQQPAQAQTQVQTQPQNAAQAAAQNFMHQQASQNTIVSTITGTTNQVAKPAV